MTYSKKDKLISKFDTIKHLRLNNKLTIKKLYETDPEFKKYFDEVQRAYNYTIEMNNPWMLAYVLSFFNLEYGISYNKQINIPPIPVKDEIQTSIIITAISKRISEAINFLIDLSIQKKNIHAYSAKYSSNVSFSP